MCSTGIPKTLKERVSNYINRRETIEQEYKNKLKALQEEASKDILEHCTIKVGDVYAYETCNAWGTDRKYYKVSKLTASIDGLVKVEGYKRKLDRTWGAREVFMFYVNNCSDCKLDANTKFELVEDYVEPNKN